MDKKPTSTPRSWCLIFLFPLLAPILVFAQAKDPDLPYNTKLKVGAEQQERYLSLIKGKGIAVVANQTSMVGKVHLVDTLLKLGVKIKVVFAPEHGFRGEGDAGEHIQNDVDKKTGLKVISLYGNHKKPTAQDLEGVEVVVFDIQDVGARFYTYISTMHYVMEACAEEHKTFLVLDRPNPNGFYVDGPVLDTTCRSFVGMHPVPIVHGLTVAEYACMINGEHWLHGGLQCKLAYVLVKDYSHKDFYRLPVKPSPNLADMHAIILYPSLCLFEGTIVSVGRGTDKPFRVVGYPGNTQGSYKFTPQSMPGAKKPLYEGKICTGGDLSFHVPSIVASKQLEIDVLQACYKSCADTAHFFNTFFTSLAGNKELERQIKKGMTEVQIRKSWQKGLGKYKLIRKKYLLYKDFE